MPPSFLNGPHKGINVLTHIKTFITLWGPFKKLNYLDDTKTSFLGPFKLFIFYEKILHALKALKELKVLKAPKA